MGRPDTLTLNFGNEAIPRAEAEIAGEMAYRYFTAHTKPELSPLTILSYAIRSYRHGNVDHNGRHNLTESGFLTHGTTAPLRRRLRLPARVALSMIVPEVEGEDLVGEHLQEPFLEAAYLDEWYEMPHPTEKPPGTRLSWLK